MRMRVRVLRRSRWGRTRAVRMAVGVTMGVGVLVLVRARVRVPGSPGWGEDALQNLLHNGRHAGL